MGYSNALACRTAMPRSSDPLTADGLQAACKRRRRPLDLVVHHALRDLAVDVVARSGLEVTVRVGGTFEEGEWEVQRGRPANASLPEPSPLGLLSARHARNLLSLGGR